MQVEVETGLDFDRLVLIGQGGGMARLAPDGNRTVGGAVAALGGRAMIGSVRLTGEPGQVVTISIPERIELFGLNGGRLVVTRIITDLKPMPRLDSSGRLTFRFGGELEISGTAEGDYRGDISITVDAL